MSHVNGIDFLCGKVVEVWKRPDGSMKVSTRNDEVTVVVGQDEVKAKITEGRRRMIVLHNGVIIGVFGRPRIRLLQMILRGAPITEEVIECSLPMWPKVVKDKKVVDRKTKPKTRWNWLDSHTGR